MTPERIAEIRKETEGYGIANWVTRDRIINRELLELLDAYEAGQRSRGAPNSHDIGFAVGTMEAILLTAELNKQQRHTIKDAIGRLYKAERLAAGMEGK